MSALFALVQKISLWALLLYCSIVGYTGIIVFRSVEVRRLTHSTYPQVSELGPTVIYAILLMIVHKMCQNFMLPVANVIITEKGRWSNVVLESKLRRFGSAVFKFVFFIALSAYAWVYGLAEAEWMPEVLLGTGSIKRCWGEGNAGDTQRPIGAAMTRFYHVALAYHMSELAFQILYEKAKPDFVEMFAHHVTTCFLLFASFYANFVRIGSLVLFIHYVSDIPVYGAKIFVDTPYKIVTFVNLIGMLTSWGFLRLYVLPAFIIKSTLLECTSERATWGHTGDIVYYIFNVALSFLVCLHVYWYFLFVKMGWGYLFKGETKDVQANLSFMDAKAAKTQSVKNE